MNMRMLSRAETRNRPVRVGAIHGEATKPSGARAERRGYASLRENNSPQSTERSDP